MADGEVVGVQGDLTDSDDVTHIVEETVDAFDGLDHLVTNAGDPTRGSFFDVTDEDWQHAFDLLVMSVVRLVRAAADPLGANSGGTVVNIASITLREPVDTLVLSSSVRLTVEGLTKVLSRELAPEIRVNTVLPGPIETPALKNIVKQAVAEGEYDSYDEGLRSYWPDGTPLERIGEPRELGETIAYLSSPRSSYVNGESVLVDGGATRSNR